MAARTFPRRRGGGGRDSRKCSRKSHGSGGKSEERSCNRPPPSSDGFGTSAARPRARRCQAPARSTPPSGSSRPPSARGGMRDHLGGGFHRYSVDGDWRVPHFEKMLYDQAQLTLAYLEAAQLTGDPFYAEVAADTLAYVRRDMTDEA